MIDVYSWPTPNGHKVHVMLEECGQRLGRDWRAIPVNIGAGDQFKPEFLKISPNNKMPAIVDTDGPGGKTISLFESGAILIYLADKTGQLIPKDLAGRYETIQWVMFQMGGMLGGLMNRFAGDAAKDGAVETMSIKGTRQLTSTAQNQVTARREQVTAHMSGTNVRRKKKHVTFAACSATGTGSGSLLRCMTRPIGI